MPKAIITGGSRGLGRAVAADLVQHGWDVLITARTPGDLAEVSGVLGPHVEHLAGDITHSVHRRQITEAAGAGLDLLVNNAGTLGPSPLPELGDLFSEDLRRLFEINVVGPVALTRSLLPQLRASRGAVVNITSDAAITPYRGWGGYGATKAALELVSKVLAVEEPSLGVFALDPGDIRTDMHQAAFPGEDISDRPLPDAVAPAVRHLAEARPASGRYQASALVGIRS